MTVPRISVAMATFEGERYVAEQIRSVLAQDLAQIELVVSDDGSSDGTLDVCRRLAAEDERVRVLKPAGVRLGLIGNFERALRHTRGRLVALSDQDDVWLPDKLSSLAAKLDDGFDLAACDLRVVGPDRKPIHPSFVRYQRLRIHEGRALRHVLIRNFVTGCGTLFTRDLLEAALPFPKACLFHDWWLAVVAAARGGIGWVDRPLVDYRQHEGNVIGATGSGVGRITRALRSADDAVNPQIYEPALQRVRSYATRSDIFRTDEQVADLAFAFRYFEDQVARERLSLGRRLVLLRDRFRYQPGWGVAGVCVAVAATLAPRMIRQIVWRLGARRDS